MPRELAMAEIIAGSAEDVVIPLRDDADAPLLSLAGWTGRCQVRRSPGSTGVLAEWATEDGSMVLEDSTARLVMSAARAEASLAWDWRLGWFDLVLTTPVGQGSLPLRPIQGIIRRVPGITT